MKEHDKCECGHNKTDHWINPYFSICVYNCECIKYVEKADDDKTLLMLENNDKNKSSLPQQQIQQELHSIMFIKELTQRQKDALTLAIEKFDIIERLQNEVLAWKNSHNQLFKEHQKLQGKYVKAVLHIKNLLKKGA